MRQAFCGLFLAAACGAAWVCAAGWAASGDSVPEGGRSAVAAAEPKAGGSAEPKAAGATNPKADGATDPMSVNGACYVCHMTFVRESLSKSHLKAKVGCVNCHGLSAKHANDENIGATKPDVLFKSSDVDPMCIKCHEGHNAPARKVLARFQERKLSAGDMPTCTQCHGEHKIMR